MVRPDPVLGITCVVLSDRLSTITVLPFVPSQYQVIELAVEVKAKPDTFPEGGTLPSLRKVATVGSMRCNLSMAVIGMRANCPLVGWMTPARSVRVGIAKGHIRLPSWPCGSSCGKDRKPRSPQAVWNNLRDGHEAHIQFH